MSKFKPGDAVMMPLHQLLRRIPTNAVYQWEDGEGVSHSTPIGRFAHEAADRLVAPDTGQAKRIRKWLSAPIPSQKEHEIHGYLFARRQIAALLDTQEAEPEPPPAAVTREERTLRDEFAMAALTGMLGDPGHDGQIDAYYAKDAYRFADAMLAARLRGEEE